MADWQSGFIKANGLNIHYTRTGGTGPILVLVHGFTDDGLCWMRVARALEPDYDIVIPDTRGHGRSEAPESGYGLVELATDLAGVIDGLDLGRPPILGHSLGAITTLALAGLRPDIPGAVLLEDPPDWWVKGPEPGRSQAFLADIEANHLKTRQELIAERRGEEPHWHEDELGPWADAQLRVSVNVVRWASPKTVDWVQTLARVACPALLITADPERGAIVTTESAAALQAAVPQVQIARFPTAGHSIHRDTFDGYLAAVRVFLEKTTG